MGKDEKKTHNKFHRDQTNESWLKSKKPMLEEEEEHEPIH